MINFFIPNHFKKFFKFKIFSLKRLCRKPSFNFYSNTKEDYLICKIFKGINYFFIMKSELN